MAPHQILRAKSWEKGGTVENAIEMGMPGLKWLEHAEVAGSLKIASFQTCCSMAMVGQAAPDH